LPDRSNWFAPALCAEVDLTPRSAVVNLIDEADQLRRIFTASQLTAKRRDRREVSLERSAVWLLQYSAFHISHSAVN